MYEWTFLPFLYSCVIEARCLKSIKIEVSFVSIPGKKSLLKAGTNRFIQFSTLFVITLNRVMPDGRNIVGVLHMKILAYWYVETHW